MPIWSLTVLETLENPILSGTFGLGIKYTSYVFIFTIVCDSVGLAIVYVCYMITDTITVSLYHTD